MNVNALKQSPSESSAWSSKQSKKSKKKKRRNKNKLYSLRLKKHKSKSNSTKPSFKSPVEYNNNKIMSNWYWSNYQKAVEWRDKHELAHWKACALALQEENRYLLQIINQMRPGMNPTVSVTWENYQKRRGGQGFNASRVDNSGDADAQDDNEEEQGSDEDVEFEMSEEMIQFFKKSFKHKENLKKLKEQESAKKAEEEVKQLQVNRLKRIAEMQLLYGEGASMIIGMETAVQLSYEKFCETKSPKYWPNIPFRNAVAAMRTMKMRVDIVRVGIIFCTANKGEPVLQHYFSDSAATGPCIYESKCLNILMTVTKNEKLTVK